jgi:hypothetical protein
MHVAKLNETDYYNMISAVDYWNSPQARKKDKHYIAKQTSGVDEMGLKTNSLTTQEQVV